MLTKARAYDLAEIEIDPLCEALWFPKLDEGFSVSGLLVKIFREAARAELNRAAARQTSPKKAAAARRNGRKGGRPPRRRTSTL